MIPCPGFQLDPPDTLIARRILNRFQGTAPDAMPTGSRIDKHPFDFGVASVAKREYTTAHGATATAGDENRTLGTASASTSGTWQLAAG